MPRVKALISDFSAGEVAPWFFGKTQNPVYYKSASQMINFMPRAQGGFRKAPGTIFCGHTKTDQVAQFYAIKISATQSYLLEFTNNLVRFWSFTGGNSDLHRWTGHRYHLHDSAVASASVCLDVPGYFHRSSESCPGQGFATARDQLSPCRTSTS